MIIQDLDPKTVWKNFYKLTQIPRPSKHEGAVVEFVKEFGTSLGLDVESDDVGNVVIRKPATAGKENAHGVILQAHLDMVPQKNSAKKHDFTSDPIETVINGEWVTANETTLGADNGIGVAAIMSVLEADNIAHGPVEALFTVDEETGMTGAFVLKPGWLKGKILLNLDSEEDGELYVGCAGGLDSTAEWGYAAQAAQQDFIAVELFLKGLKGGHSGLDINLGRANANKLIVRIIHELSKRVTLFIQSIDGGDLRNAIPREASAVIFIDKGNLSDVKDAVASILSTIQSEYEHADPDIEAFIAETKPDTHACMDDQSAEKLIQAVYACPNGVIRMSDTMEGVVETSTNLAIVKATPNEAEAHCLLRSSVETAKAYLADQIESVFKLSGASVHFHGNYPGWRPNPESAILKTMIEVYEQIHHKVPAIKAIHAGLECGILGSKYPNWDMISFGPTIRFPHSPDEKVHIESVGNFWEYLKATLEAVS